MKNRPSLIREILGCKVAKGISVFLGLGEHLGKEESSLIPVEINDHLRRFGKQPWDVDYNLFEYCSMCNTRIDEFGFCACGGAAD